MEQNYWTESARSATLEKIEQMKAHETRAAIIAHLGKQKLFITDVKANLWSNLDPMAQNYWTEAAKATTPEKLAQMPESETKAAIIAQKFGK